MTDPRDARALATDHAPAPGTSIAWESPEAVMADDTLSVSQKRRFLEDWRDTLAEHVRGGEVTHEDAEGEADLMRRIDGALDLLPAD